MLIDTHSHFGLVPMVEKPEEILARARTQNVLSGIITTGSARDFDLARNRAYQFGWGYTVGIHPLYVSESSEHDLELLSDYLERYHDDERLVGIGEIGLDRFGSVNNVERQEYFFKVQLELAQKYQLPVSVHSRKALFRVTDLLQPFTNLQVALHAFSGSLEQAKLLASRGYKMGFGGAITYPGSKRVRQAAQVLPSHALILETDTPDMSPYFHSKGPSEPSFLSMYLLELAQLRHVDPQSLESQIFLNTLELFPKMKPLL